MNLRTRLMVFGGGPLPQSGFSKFLGWADEFGRGKESGAELLYVAWASEMPESSHRFFEEEVRKHSDLPLSASLEPPVTSAERERFFAQLSRASAVFFSGGNQNRIASVYADAGAREALHAAYRSGLPFAGTSAGTAIMSELMFIGDCDPGSLDRERVRLTEGLGFVSDVIFDQHFLKRQRQNRLFAAVLANPERVGIGVDEGTGLEIIDGEFATVVGPEKVMRVSVTGARPALHVELFHEGERFLLLPEGMRTLPDREAS